MSVTTTIIQITTPQGKVLYKKTIAEHRDLPQAMIEFDQHFDWALIREELEPEEAGEREEITGTPI